jgi:hypothetical protein
MRAFVSSVSSRADSVFAAKVHLWDNVLSTARHEGLQMDIQDRVSTSCG